MKTFTFALLLLAITDVFGAAPTISSFLPAAGGTGTVITINGTNFTGVTAVTIGGLAPSSYNVLSATQITATVAGGSSGSVLVTTAGGTASKAGFIFSVLTDIITDFGGYWPSSTSSPNAVVPNTSHNLLAFKYNGVMYSTGANNNILDTKGVTYSAGNYKALPVAGVGGTTVSGSSTYLAIAKNVDGSSSVANPVAIAGYTVKSVLTDGINGLNLGTGVTNLPASAILKFQIVNIDPAKISDNEPDILITQIAQPVSGNDVYSFVDASGTLVGTPINHDMTLDAALGTYDLDLFNLQPNKPYNYATVYSAYLANTNREIRLVALKLSDFGITVGNVAQIRALQITPSNNSDYAFIAYNANSINIPPNITTNDAGTNATICTNGTAKLAVIAAGSSGGSLSYAWERSVNAGSTWAPVTDNATFSGSATNTLSIINAANNDKYRVTVTESGNVNTSTSPVFTIVVSAPTAPTAVTITAGSTTCLNNALTLTAAVTGGSNLYYQWQLYNGTTYNDISGANLNVFTPPVNATGTNSYRVAVSSGSGCPGVVVPASPSTITVSGIASTTPAERCGTGVVALNATATSGTIDWYAADAGGSSLYTGNTFNTGSLPSSSVYYVSSSGCASALRVSVPASVDPVSVGGAVNKDTTVYAGVNTAPLILSGNTGNVLKWQSSTDNFATDITLINTTANNYSASNLAATTQYRAVVQSGVCPQALSSAAQITVVPPITLATANVQVEGTQIPDGIRIDWKVTDERDVKNYTVEKFIGGAFTGVYTVAATGALTGSYAWNDLNASGPGYNLYRIKTTDQSGNAVFSNIVKISTDIRKTGISVYPNPVVDEEINFQLSGAVAGTYSVVLYSIAGQKSAETEFVHPGGNASIPTHFIKGLPNGAYEIVVTGPGGARTNLQIVILNK